MTSAEKKLTVVYDNTCRTCTVAQLVGEKLDTTGSIEYVGMHTDEGKALVEKHGLDMEKSAYAISADGTVASHSDMVHTVLDASGFLGKVFSSMLRMLPKTLADKIYDFVSKHRIR